jgi:hypothetical protein
VGIIVKAPGTTRQPQRFNGAAACLAGSLLLALALAGCGGGGGGTPPPSGNPVPTLTSISPTSATAGGVAFTLTANGSNFISSSVVRWGGANRTTTFVSSTQLTATIPASDLVTAGTVQVTVFNPSPGGGTSAGRTFSIAAAQPLAITTTQLPPSSGGKAYDVTLGSVGGTPPITWAVTTGSLPGTLALDPASGRIAGTLDVVSSDTTSNFTVQATDSSATPQPDSKLLSILVKKDALGSNDTCPAGATPISNGRIRASISPYGDIDVYSFQGTAGAEVTIEIFAQRLDLDGDPTTQDSYLDSIIELLDSSCTPIAVNDDIDPTIIVDSRISVSSTPFPPPCSYTPCGDIPPPISLPYTGTYYIRVRDLRGDGRPDLIYELSLSGAN